MRLLLDDEEGCCCKVEVDGEEGAVVKVVVVVNVCDMLDMLVIELDLPRRPEIEVCDSMATDDE